MKQGLIITAGVALIIIVCLVWAYLLFFGTPQDPDALFANLGFSEETSLSYEEARVIDPATEFETSRIDIDSAALAQLTTRPIAGFAFVKRDGDTFIQYAERGVGHIYEIDLAFAQEERILAKTYTAVSDAVFSPSGEAVVLIAYNPAGTTAFLEEIAENGTNHTLPADIEHVSFMSDTELRYTKSDDNGTTGYEYNLETKETTELFTIPFTDVTVIWEDGRIFAYNRPAPYLKGGLYEIGNSLTRIGNTGYGLSAIINPNQDVFILSATNPDIDSNTLLSRAVDSEGTEVSRVPLSVLPEKCILHPYTLNLWCAAPSILLSRTYQRDWYQGTVQSSDILWNVDLDEENVRAEVNLSERTGRMIDVTDLSIDETGTKLAFKNKVDGTLWFYDTEFDIEIEETASDDETVLDETMEE